ncbi:MAG: Gfo/Idh/MocA family oxidoreductase [Bryobacteraceae bacterium]
MTKTSFADNNQLEDYRIAMTIRQQTPMPARPLPIVIIGAGGIVETAHLPAYRKAHFPVAGIFDLDANRAHALAARTGIPRVYASIPELVEHAPAGAVFDIATPASAFLPILGQMPHGATVLLQKPMGETMEQATAIRDVCRRRRLTAAVNFQLRYAPNILAARSLIEQGVIGEIYDLEVHINVYTPWHLWTFLNGIPRVEILYHSVHYVDLIRSFLADPGSVWAHTAKQSKRPHIASTRTSIILRYGDSVRATINVNHDHEFGPRHQQSYVKWEGARGAIRTTLGLLMDYPKGVTDEFEYCVLEEGTPASWVSVPLEGTWFPDGFSGCMAALMCYAGGSSTTVPHSVEDAWRTMAVVEAAYQSSASQGTTVSYD